MARRLRIFAVKLDDGESSASLPEMLARLDLSEVEPGLRREGASEPRDVCWLTDADLRALGVQLVPLRKLRAHLTPICARHGTNVQARPGEGHGGVGGVSVRDFGAMGNANFFNDDNQKWYADAEFTVEANDDTKMVQRAVDAVRRTPFSGGGRLYLSPGSYLISDTVHLHEDLILSGEMAAVVAEANSSTPIFLFEAPCEEGSSCLRGQVTIENL